MGTRSSQHLGGEADSLGNKIHCVHPFRITQPALFRLFLALHGVPSWGRLGCVGLTPQQRRYAEDGMGLTPQQHGYAENSVGFTAWGEALLSLPIQSHSTGTILAIRGRN